MSMRSEGEAKINFARAVSEVFGDEVIRHRALANKGSLDHVAVTFSVRRDRGWQSATALIGTSTDIVEGNVTLPGIPFVHVIASEAALRALFSGRGDVSSLAILGEIRVEGDSALLTELAACLRTGENALSVRLRK